MDVGAESSSSHGQNLAWTIVSVPSLLDGVWGLGFGIWDLRLGVWVLRFGVLSFGFKIKGLGFGVWMQNLEC